jgi:hypothetical protein
LTFFEIAEAVKEKGYFYRGKKLCSFAKNVFWATFWAFFHKLIMSLC